MLLAEPAEVEGAWLLADALDWTGLTSAQYMHRVTREDAVGKLKVNHALSGHERDVRWQVAWRGFSTAWRLGLHMGVPIECGTVTPVGIAMSLEQALAYCVPTNEDQGLLAKALLTVLARYHNTLCALADAHFECEKESPTLSRPQVSSRDFLREHSVCAAFQDPSAAVSSLCVFVERHCLTYAETRGALHVNLAAAEDWVAREVVGRTCPSVKLEIRTMRFASESNAADALLLVRSRVPQRPLDAAMVLSAKRMDPAVAHEAARQLSRALVAMADTIARDPAFGGNRAEDDVGDAGKHGFDDGVDGFSGSEGAGGDATGTGGAAQDSGGKGAGGGSKKTERRQSQSRAHYIWAVLLGTDEAGTWLGDVRLQCVAAADALLRRCASAEYTSGDGRKRRKGSQFTSEAVVFAKHSKRVLCAV